MISRRRGLGALPALAAVIAMAAEAAPPTEFAAELQVPADPDGAIVVTSLWSNRTDYETWGAHPARAELAGRLVGLLSDAHLDEYEVVLRAARG